MIGDNSFSMKNKKQFYEEHGNYSRRTISEYYISPGIRCKFDILKERIGTKFIFKKGLDLGCSGNSFLFFLENCVHKSYFDIATLPLAQYTKTWNNQTDKNKIKQFGHPLCGDIVRLPYQDRSFDFVSALDVLEHIENDELAASEISRVVENRGIVVATVPHREIFYSNQDKIIGHYRRYEIDRIRTLFCAYNLKLISIFGVYGRLMRISLIQGSNPKQTEESIQKLRDKYDSEPNFQKFWDVVVRISSKVMKFDATHAPRKKIRNIGFIFIKI